MSFMFVVEFHQFFSLIEESSFEYKTEYLLKFPSMLKFPKMSCSFQTDTAQLLTHPQG